MKILVFSDTHGATRDMIRVIENNINTANMVIHLGDRASDVAFIRDKYPQLAFLYVKGNNDFFGYGSDAPSEYTVNLDGYRFFMIHGHLNGVKGNCLYGLEFEAAKRKCNVVLYGHTHIAKYIEKNGVHYFNPGSLEEPRDASGGTYGIINISNGKISFEIKAIMEEHF